MRLPPRWSATRTTACATSSRIPDHPEERQVSNKLTRKSLLGVAGRLLRARARLPVPAASASSTSTSTSGTRTSSCRSCSSARSCSPTTPTRRFSARSSTSARTSSAWPFRSPRPSTVSARRSRPARSSTWPEYLSLNIGHPLGPYLKASAFLFAQYDDYKSDSDTAPTFVVPTSTFTLGAGLRLNWSQAGYNVTAEGDYYDRQNWAALGRSRLLHLPAVAEGLLEVLVSVQKGFYFADFRKLLVKVDYLGGKDLDRFSQWDFGPFSTHSMTGFPSGSVLADSAWLNNLSYGLNIENVIRFELEYDQALVTNRRRRVPATRTSPASASRPRSTARGTTRASAPTSAIPSSTTA